MLTLLLAGLPWAGIVAFLIHTHRGQDRERFEALVAEREAAAVERRTLLNRIQAPEAARKQAEVEIPKIPDEPPYVPWGDTEAFHRAHADRYEIVTD